MVNSSGFITVIISCYKKVLTIAYNIDYRHLMKNFQSKEIQEILSMPKFRYDYIMMRIGVQPGVEKAVGRGKTNLFSFSNLLEFAVANTAMNLCMLPDVIKKSLQHIWQVDGDLRFFSDKADGKSFSYHIAYSMNVIFYCFSGDVPNYLKPVTIFRIADSQDTPNKMDMVESILGQINIQNINSDFNYQESLGYLTLNLSKIKENVISKV